jgi:protoheme ferro-lyase
VPPFFQFPAFIGQLQGEYAAVNDYSPHNDAIAEHVAALNVGAYGQYVDKYLAFLDAVPRIPDVLHQIARKWRYKRIVVVPLLLADSTHTQEVEEITHEWAAKERPMEILIGEPYFEVPYMRKKLVHAIAGMAEYIRSAVPAGIADEKIGVILAAHGTPYVPPYPEFGYMEGDIYSKLTLTEGDFHDDIAGALPWDVRDGRMSYGVPLIEESIAAFAADGKTHVIVVPSAFPTAAIHTMWDVAMAAVERPVLPAEGIVPYAHPAGVQVYYTAKGYADVEPGRSDFRAGLRFMAEMGLLELFENNRDAYGID